MAPIPYLSTPCSATACPANKHHLPQHALFYSLASFASKLKAFLVYRVCGVWSKVCRISHDQMHRSSQSNTSEFYNLCVATKPIILHSSPEPPYSPALFGMPIDSGRMLQYAQKMQRKICRPNAPPWTVASWGAPLYSLRVHILTFSYTIGKSNVSATAWAIFRWKASALSAMPLVLPTLPHIVLAPGLKNHPVQ